MKALQRYMDENGLSQTQLAAKLGVCQPTVSYWLSGGKHPSGSRLRDISRCTGLTVDSLLGLRRRAR
jgi:transcriptional regulator with XRE-family HTH domain